MTVVLAIDAGTTGVRTRAVHDDGRPSVSSYREFTQHFPRPGWVEHDASEIWDAVVATLADVASRVDGTIAAIGITNQRETTVVWDRRTGEPIHPAIVWQDRRTASLCDDLKARGFAAADCLVGIAAGGTTPYVIGALAHARSIGALTIALACVPADQAPMPCDIDLRLLTGPELVAGSTRLKAGTATKMALNILSTGVMVRLGKVHGNRMVDVAVTNAKLEDRALRILRDLADVPRDQGRTLLEASSGSVKQALVMALTGLEAEPAATALAEHGPSLRSTLAALDYRLKAPQ